MGRTPKDERCKAEGRPLSAGARVAGVWSGVSIGLSCFDAGGDIPHMALWIDYSPDPITPRLILGRQDHACSPGNRPRDHRVHRVAIKVQDHRRASVGFRRPAGKMRRDLMDHYEGFMNLEGRMDDAAVSPLAPGEHRRSEGLPTKFNLRRGIAAGQHRNDELGLHADGRKLPARSEACQTGRLTATGNWKGYRDWRGAGLPSRRIAQRHCARAELPPAHQLQIDRLRQPRE